jgi:hypothetical protein
MTERTSESIRETFESPEIADEMLEAAGAPERTERNVAPTSLQGGAPPFCH